MSHEEDQVFVGDVGLELTFTITDDGTPVDISGADTREVHMVKPVSDTVVQLGGGNLAFVTDGTDGQIVYTTQAGDLDEAGWYRLQAKIGFPAGTVYGSEIKRIRVRSPVYA